VIGDLMLAIGGSMLVGLLMGVVIVAVSNIEQIIVWFRARRRRKIAAIEAELDRKAEELQQEIYEMASQLRLGSQKAREDMIREAYRRAGRVPREGSEPRNRPPRK